KLRVEMDSMPEELDAISRRIMQMEIERAAIKREKDARRLKELHEQVATLSDERNQQKAKCESDRQVVVQIQNTKEGIENFKLKGKNYCILKKSYIKE